MASINPRKRGPPSSNPQQSQPQQQQTYQQKHQGNQTHDRKRLKLQDARLIAVQSSEGALKAGQLDINAFIKTREFEIRALEEAMGNSKRANNKRAFQSVPRSMRRRTASHNVKKVPKRLRGRHAREMADDNTPTVTSRRRKPTSHKRLRVETARRLERLAKIKAKGASGDDAANIKLPRDKVPLVNTLRPPPAAASKFRKRQVKKTWLATHIWHAKRAHMVARWRFAIAEKPTEKCYRQTHRASTLRGAVAWDRSYYATVLVRGKSVDITRLLAEILSPEDAIIVCEAGPVKQGRRAWDGWTYERGSFPLKPIAPTTILWARAPENTDKPVSESTDTADRAKGPTHRELLLRIHPSAFIQLWMAILTASREYPSVSVQDLRFDIGSIEITGPAATDALLAVLQPRNETPAKDSPEDIWQNLRSLTNPSSLPPGAFLGFDIMDPRLRFPPRLAPLPQGQEEARVSNLYNVISTWPTDTTQPAPLLFSREARIASVRAHSSQKSINSRKTATMPGELVQALETDPSIPVILLAHRYHSSFSTQAGKSFSANSSNAIGSWTLLLPWKWTLPIWYSIMHFPGVRFGGIEQSAQLCYENGVGSFPEDFPGTKAGYEEEMRRTAERKALWEKRPKQKRTAWESVELGKGRKGELGNGESCDWKFLIDDILKRASTGATPPIPALPAPKSTKPVSTEKSGDSMDIEPSIPPAGQIPPPIEITRDLSAAPSSNAPAVVPFTPEPWYIPSSILKSIINYPHAPLPPALTNLPPNSLNQALFNVRITFLHRGAPADRARVYRLPLASETSPSAVKCREAWLGLLESHNLQRKCRGEASKLPPTDCRQKFIDMGASRFRLPQRECSRVILPPLQAGDERYPEVPGEEDLIGYVTSGNYNLKEGKGTGVGAVAFVRAFPHFGDVAGGGDGAEVVVGKKAKMKGKMKGKGKPQVEANPVSTLCIVRDAGNSVGRLARWEAI